jgi:hypothetical protein
MKTANYFDNFDALVMHIFVSDVLSAFTFLDNAMRYRATSKRARDVFLTLSVAQKFALALELVSIFYALDDATFNDALSIMSNAQQRLARDDARYASLDAFAEFQRERHDVQTFAVAASRITVNASNN